MSCSVPFIGVGEITFNRKQDHQRGCVSTKNGCSWSQPMNCLSLYLSFSLRPPHMGGSACHWWPFGFNIITRVPECAQGSVGKKGGDGTSSRHTSSVGDTRRLWESLEICLLTLWRKEGLLTGWGWGRTVVVFTFTWRNEKQWTCFYLSAKLQAKAGKSRQMILVYCQKLSAPASPERIGF